MSHEAYRKASKSLASPRDAEYRAFSEATRRLMGVAESGRADLKALVEAVLANRRLWDALADDCARGDNLLPKETRTAIIRLSHWVADHSRAVMQRKESVDALIDVNRIIMEGLAGKSAA